MKFLCVSCDEPMALQDVRGPHEGSMSVIFGCPSCAWEVAMLTNSMETQMVRSLGVKIGGRTVPAEPMEMVRASLAPPGDGASTTEAPAAAPQNTPAPADDPKCPFPDMAAAMPEAAATTPTVAPHGETTADATTKSGKCPFTGMVNDAFEQQQASGPVWTPEAEARIARIPSFAQAMVRKSIEQHAAEHGHAQIDGAVMDEVKGMFGM